MSSFVDRAAPRLPVLDPQSNWEGRLNREEEGEEDKVFNPVSGRNVPSETGSRGAGRASSSASDERAELARYLAANPRRTARDFKGKGRIAFEPPRRMTEADELRLYLARNPGKTARDFKGKGYRPDPWHDWAPPSLTAADRPEATPAPSPVAGEPDGEGARKVGKPTEARPAACMNLRTNMEFRAGTRAHAAARPLARGDEK